jgi:hypothetical protein
LVGSYEPQKKENQTDNKGIVWVPYQIAPDVILYTTYLSGSQNIGVVQPLINQCDKAFDEKKIL